jgi:PKD domain
LQKNAVSQLYGSFFGQNGGFTDHADGASSRFDKNGVLYQTICANCNGIQSPTVVFPTTAGSWSTINPGSGCNQAGVKMDLRFGRALSAGLKATSGGIAKDTSCLPFTVLLTDTIASARKYKWNFGDGSPEVNFYAPPNLVSHQFTTVGSFRITLVAADSLSCNLTDTVYKTITVQDCSGGQFCYADSIYLTSGLAGNSYQWQWMRPDFPYFENSYTNINDNATLIGTNNRTLLLKNAPSNWYGYKLRCQVDGAGSNVSILKFVSYWTGAISNAWEDPGNWSCGRVPDLYTDVIVNNGAPVLNSYRAVRSLTLGTGVSLNVNPGFNLTIVH